MAAGISFVGIHTDGDQEVDGCSVAPGRVDGQIQLGFSTLEIHAAKESIKMSSDSPAVPTGENIPPPPHVSTALIHSK